MYYYLIDDTMEIRETKTRFSQNDQFTRLLSRTRLPKNIDKRPGYFACKKIQKVIKHLLF